MSNKTLYETFKGDVQVQEELDKLTEAIKGGCEVDIEYGFVSLHNDFELDRGGMLQPVTHVIDGDVKNTHRAVRIIYDN